MAKFKNIKSRFAAQFKKRKTKRPISKSLQMGVQDVARGTFAPSAGISEALGMKSIRLKERKKKKKRTVYTKVGGRFVKSKR